MWRNLSRIVAEQSLYYYFVLVFTGISCSGGTQRTNIPITGTQSEKAKETALNLSEEEASPDFRQEFISLYHAPFSMDTSFYDEGKKYNVIFHHISTMDSNLIVPAVYNFDTKKDFITHNFISHLTVITGKDTLFSKQITKATFQSLTDTVDLPLDRYGTLLYPNLYINRDSIQISYSMTIPVTDIGIGVKIIFDYKGNYIIGQ